MKKKTMSSTRIYVTITPFKRFRKFDNALHFHTTYLMSHSPH